MVEWMDLRYAVVDVEGNGRQPPDVVELAVVPIAGGVVGHPVSWLVKPADPISPVATRIHGITNTAVTDAPTFEDVEDEVLNALENNTLVAHNAHVDIGVLKSKLTHWRCPEVFDTLKLARRFYPHQTSYRLGSLVDALHLAKELPAGSMPHRATYDALVTARLFVKLANGAGSLAVLRGGTLEKRRRLSFTPFLTGGAGCSSASMDPAASESPP